MQVILLGDLGNVFGREHMFEIRFPREAINALAANFKNFRKHLAESKCGYQIIVGRKYLDSLDELHNPISSKESITIVPVIEGAASGTAKIFAGIAILGVAAIALTYPGAALWVGKAGLALLGVGLSTTLGGITQLLTPLPKAPTIAKDTDPSYAFGGPQNTSVQGYPIPLVYGQMIVGSKIISAGITIEEIFE